MRKANSHISPIRLPLTLAVLACLQAAPVLAQDASETQKEAASEPAKKPGTTDLDRMTVTGSLIRRADYETTSPVFTIETERNTAQGQVNVGEFLQKSAIGAAETQITHQFGGFVVDGGTGVQTFSLRGLGANRTLVLLDGQRPGPAGTRGAVGAFDLNVIPTAVLQRAEIVKDGSSSIYGSDAVAGVVNLITKKNFERPELTVTSRIPQHGGGEVFSASIANGWNFDKGSIVAAVEWYRHNELTRGDRDFFSCAEDLVKDADGNRIDRTDASIYGPRKFCNNLQHNYIAEYGTSKLWVPSADGSTNGPFAGYVPRQDKTYANGSTQAYTQIPTNFSRYGEAHIINRQERKSAYVASDFGFDSFNWKTQFLYNRRDTENFSWRQFFPYLPAPGTARGIAQPVMPFKSITQVQVDYYYLANKLDGLFAGSDTWGWEVNANYSRSSGTYRNLGIDTRLTGDLGEENSGDTPAANFFDPGYLSGAKVDELVNILGIWHTGKTTFDQATVNAIFSGELFNMPAGAVGMAAGVEYRYYKINDQPSQESRNGFIWGSSSADVTKGDDKVKEAFVEFEVPLLKGITGIESLTANASGRIFKYDSVDGSDNVWKLGLNWQINPALRIRGTVGTSYRAPGLYELYLGNQTGFLGQTAIDPCIRWGESSNDQLRANCGSIGIPQDYAGNGSSATIYTSGGAGQLKPETSTAKSVGLVFTPTFANLSVALDYFDYEVKDQIASLGAGDIVSGCYGAASFPNKFCELMSRNPANDPDTPFMITEVRAQYININKQRTRGWDLTANWEHEFGFGKLSLDTQVTYTLEDVMQLFDSAEASGLSDSNQLGYIGRPELVANMGLSLKRGDWTYNWLTQYIGETENKDLKREFTYLGRPNSYRDITADARFYHTASMSYDQPDWQILVGIANVFDTKPALVSTGAATRYGNVPAFATQYDYYGRTPFVRLKYKF
ncbi:TonB-dependent receptor plug domain-containing protein [Stenotrophomonas acidaminiphila]|jgi:iron complex outermembrane receptor protein|uniref:TonB-dependent receptor plug domain-containing protein n=1 Tax=Stenotrophomonas acidaminiphila TaxID=128780 RepID=UPI003BEFB12A